MVVYKANNKRWFNNYQNLWGTRIRSTARRAGRGWRGETMATDLLPILSRTVGRHPSTKMHWKSRAPFLRPRLSTRGWVTWVWISRRSTTRRRDSTSKVRSCHRCYRLTRWQSSSKILWFCPILSTPTGTLGLTDCLCWEWGIPYRSWSRRILIWGRSWRMNGGSWRALGRGFASRFRTLFWGLFWKIMVGRPVATKIRRVWGSSYKILKTIIRGLWSKLRNWNLSSKSSLKVGEAAFFRAKLMVGYVHLACLWSNGLWIWRRRWPKARGRWRNWWWRTRGCRRAYSIWSKKLLGLILRWRKNWKKRWRICLNTTKVAVLCQKSMRRRSNSWRRR